ncbi:MAG: DJ-1/PfpI family protein [Oscillospiraceae bacterium]|nr:DJ-1/PfpI family protein [Oscillospiraceae bacterium]
MVYVFIAHGFEEIEALTVVDILRRAETEALMAGVGSKTVTGSHGITVHCDISEREVNMREADMIVLPGGMPGTANLEKSQIVQKCIDYALAKEKWVAAICAAPSILGNRNLLDGKRATCHPAFADRLGGAQYTATPVEADGKIITANGAGSAMAFALKLAEILCSPERAKELAEAMQYV